jgi:hypothetical protein
MSREVFTPLLVAAGVFGLPLAIGLSGCSPRHEVPPGAPPPTVNAGTVYPNNYFLSGTGYYHAPYRAWFPLPFNSYDGSRGWYRGGRWRRAVQEDEDERREETQSGGFTARGLGGGGGFSSLQSSRPTPEAVQRANAGAAAHAASSVVRGGFGLSAHPAVS